MTPKKSFKKWINSTQKNSALYFLVKDDPEISKEKEEDTDEIGKESMADFLKLQQDSTTVNS